MQRPSIPSVILAVVSLGVMAAAWSMSRHNGVVIDRSFLTVLCEMPEGGEARAQQGIDYDGIAGEHEDALVYLWRTNDPQAAKAVVRCAAADLGFGGCCCTKGQTYSSLFWDGTPRKFWPALAELSPEGQARVLLLVENHADFDVGWWLEERDDFLFIHDDTSAWRKELRPEPEPQQLATIVPEEPTEAIPDK